MINEWHMILAVLWSVGLFAAGGTDLNGKGHKWIRRFILPIGLGALALLYAPWWACLGYTATLSAFLLWAMAQRLRGCIGRLYSLGTARLLSGSDGLGGR